jgi:hypothetical protein
MTACARSWSDSRNGAVHLVNGRNTDERVGVPMSTSINRDSLARGEPGAMVAAPCCVLSSQDPAAFASAKDRVLRHARRNLSTHPRRLDGRSSGWLVTRTRCLMSAVGRAASRLDWTIAAWVARSMPEMPEPAGHASRVDAPSARTGAETTTVTKSTAQRSWLGYIRTGYVSLVRSDTFVSTAQISLAPVD